MYFRKEIPNTMKLEDHKDQIDTYFASTTHQEIIAQFEEYGCKFSPIPEEDDYYIPSDDEIDKMWLSDSYVIPTIIEPNLVLKLCAEWKDNSGKMETAVSFKEGNVQEFDNEALTQSTNIDCCGFAA